MVHHPAGSSHQRIGYMVAIKVWTWSETMLRWAVAFTRCPIGTKGPKVCQENIPHTITPHSTVVTRPDGFMFSFCLLYHLNVSTEIETYQTRQHFSSLQLSNFRELLQIVASFSSFFLEEMSGTVGSSAVLCCSFTNALLHTSVVTNVISVKVALLSA